MTTTATIKPAPVRRSVTVKVPQARAFEVFTDGFGRWWPPSHHIGKTAMTGGVIEPRVGGRWYETCEDGSQCDWGKVVVWEPPSRLVLAWQLDSQFRYDPALVTEVEVRFTAEGEATRVDLEHRNLERFGAEIEKVRGSIDGPNGWRTVLAQFADAIS
jgi:uncharacterized protein YndB with AHSA1/START domain